MTGRLSRRAAFAFGILPLAFLAVFFAWPVAAIVLTGVVGPDGVRTDALIATWTSAHTRDVIAFTLAQAIASTALTVLVALPGAYVMARYEFRGKRLLRSLATIPFVLPTVVVASAFLALLGPRSPIGIHLDGSIWAILIAHVFYNYAVVLRLVGGTWAHLDPRTEEAARALGATHWRAFREVTLPLLRPAIVSASSIVFLFTLTSFGVILLLGGQGTETLEVDIYRTTAQLLDLPAAAALAMLQIAGVFTLLVLYARTQERAAISQRLRRVADVARPIADLRARLVVGATVGSMLVLLGLPLAVLVERSFAGGAGYGLDAYRGLFASGGRSGLFVPPVEAIGNSLGFAVLVVILATALGLLAAAAIAYRSGWLSRGFDSLLMLPLGTSAVTLGFGFIIALDEPPLDLRTSPLLIPLAHTLVAMPFVVRASVPLIRSIEPRLREAAAVLGASPRRVWREIDVPVIARAALIGSSFAFAVSLGEFGATLFIARPDTPTVPVAVFRLLGLPGATNFSQAMAMSTILMALTAAAILVIERFRGDAQATF
ncbi:MAG: iron ABC transporter permease [Candidatus Limnocylindrales bacterium]